MIVDIERMPGDPSENTGIGMGFEKRSWEPHFRIVALNRKQLWKQCPKHTLAGVSRGRGR